MNKQKGLTPILIVLLIALAIGGYFIYQKQTKPIFIPQPSPSPVTTSVASSSAETATWKTYINEDGHYSIKYPSKIAINYYPDPGAISLDAYNQDGSIKLKLGISYARDNSGKKIQCSNNNDCLQKLVSTLGFPADQVSYINRTILGKTIKGIKYISSDKLNSIEHQYFTFLEKGEAWNINLTINYLTPEGSKLSNQELDQILSTFKFTQ
ncbi:hypothetical protein HYU94_02870 [Candidatus Daviesbacteria bacterium]|nr:hypothetical protein [Candidatus Daviesbacteria bacterium]